jgi:hypothetical protein
MALPSTTHYSPMPRVSIVAFGEESQPPRPDADAEVKVGLKPQPQAISEGPRISDKTAGHHVEHVCQKVTPKRSDAGARPSRQRFSTACTSFFARVRCRTSAARSGGAARRPVRRGSSPRRSSWPPTVVPASRRRNGPTFTRAWAIARRSAACASTTRATRGASSRAISIAPLVVSSTTSSVASRLPAKTPSACCDVSIRPALVISPSSTIATSQKSEWTSIPIDRRHPPVEAVVGA